MTAPRYTRRLDAAAAAGVAVTDELLLPYERRTRSRATLTLASGADVVIDLPRGSVLRDGDVLVGDAPGALRVRAASEALLQVAAPGGDALALTRIAYHLGNRHVPLQVGGDSEGWLRLQEDHVLEALVRALGGIVVPVTAAFEPEPGAYGYAHAPGHSHALAPGVHDDRRHAPRIHDFVPRE